MRHLDVTHLVPFPSCISAADNSRMDPQGFNTNSRLRASDADRDRAASVLNEALAEGRLTPEEHSERLDSIYAAKTQADLVPALEDLPAVYDRLASVGLATPNAGLVSDIIACPGLDYCALATARSIPIAQRISEHFGDGARAKEVGPLKIKISGCINACGHHHAGHIGVLGVDKKGVEYYQLQLGGSGAEDASIGEVLGPAFNKHEIIDAVEGVVEVYLQRRENNERFLDTVRRVGIEPFKERAYAGWAFQI